MDPSENKGVDVEFGGSMTRGEAIGLVIIALLVLGVIVIPWFIKANQKPAPAAPIRCSPMCACPSPCACVHGRL